MVLPLRLAIFSRAYVSSISHASQVARNNNLDCFSVMLLRNKILGRFLKVEDDESENERQEGQGTPVKV